MKWARSAPISPAGLPHARSASAPRRLDWLLPLMLGVLLGRPHASSAQPCLTAGLDTTYYNAYEGPTAGEAYGQTFYAPESVITKITLWRVPSGSAGIHLYVVGTTPGSNPPYPDNDLLLLDGPTLPVSGPEPGRFNTLPFVLDPPLVLPGPGYYGWFVQAEDCFPFGTPGFLCMDYGNHYRYGGFWRTGRPYPYAGPCYLPGAYVYEGNKDFLFEIEYACDTATPVRRATWGTLKLLYR